MATPRILIVDDDSSIRMMLSVIAARAGVESDVALDGLDAVQKLDAGVYDLIILDLSMPRMNGFDLIEHLRNRNPRPAVIVLTALPLIKDLDPHVVHCVVRKPFDLGTFMALFVATATDLSRTRQASNVIEFPQPNA